MTGKFLSLLQASPTPLLADGAMGTLLHSRGTPFDQCFDALNLTNPAAVTGIHAEYLANMRTLTRSHGQRTRADRL